MFWLRNKKNNFLLHTLIFGPALIFYSIEYCFAVYYDQQLLIDTIVKVYAKIKYTIFIDNDKTRGVPIIGSRGKEIYKLLAFIPIL